MDQKRILIVEDEQISALVLEAMLTHNNLIIVGSVATGEEAVEKALSVDPDVILMDIRLKSEMTGIEAVIEIQKSKKIPVIYTTASTEKDTFDMAMKTNPLAYLVKPIVEKELINALALIP